jgi:hypothetical protein
MRTVIFEVKSIIGYRHVQIVDDTIENEDLEAEARKKIADSGVNEPSRGIYLYENDGGGGDDTLLFRKVEEE